MRLERRPSGRNGKGTGVAATAEVARRLELSPNALHRWRGEWKARGDLAFPGIGNKAVPQNLNELQRIAELERKIGQLAMEKDAEVHPFLTSYPLASLLLPTSVTR